MRYRIFSPLAGGILGLLFGSAQPLPVANADVPRVQAPEMKGLEVETRGMVHEAFAQPFELQPEPGPVAPKEPPPTVPELPPAQRPEGDNVQFLPGYWAWDADRNDFLWISGIYRNAPAGRQYVAGYWNQTPEGWRWVQGFWAGANQQQVPYTPEPPATVDNGPTLPPSDPNQFYIPGTWTYREPQWVWRPGFWSPRIAGRIWVPAHYVWTPAGFVFVDGYWDFPLEDRGLLFAPVYFTDALYRQPGWCYTPSVVISVGPLFDCLFVRHRSYYFGDYCGPRYASLGFAPWFGGYRYDPLFTYYRWQHRGNPGWATGLRQAYADRGAGRLAAPPRTFAQQTVVARQGGSAPLLATPLAQAGKNVRLTQVNQTQLVMQKRNAQRVRDIAQTRIQLEGNVSKGGAVTTKSLPLSRTGDPPLISRGTATKSQTASSGSTVSGVKRVLDTKNTHSVQAKNPPLQLQAGSSSATPRPNSGGAATNTPKLGTSATTPSIGSGNGTPRSTGAVTTNTPKLGTNTTPFNGSAGLHGGPPVRSSSPQSVTPTNGPKMSAGATPRLLSSGNGNAGVSTPRNTSPPRNVSSPAPRSNGPPSGAGVRGGGPPRSSSPVHSSGAHSNSGHSGGGRGAKR